MCSPFILDSTGAIQDDLIIGNRCPNDASLMTHHPLLLAMGSRGTIVRGHPDLCSLAHRRPQAPPGQLCRPWHPRSNSLSSLSANDAFQAHMYPEGKQARERPQMRMEALQGWVFYLLTRHPGSVAVPSHSIKALRTQPQTQPLHPESCKGSPRRRPQHLKLPQPRPGQGRRKQRMWPTYLHVLQHQPFQPLSDHPVDHVHQVGSFLGDSRRDTETDVRTEKGYGSEAEVVPSHTLATCLLQTPWLEYKEQKGQQSRDQPELLQRWLWAPPWEGPLTPCPARWGLAHEHRQSLSYCALLYHILQILYFPFFFLNKMSDNGKHCLVVFLVKACTLFF